jgi:hypothetical protein
MTKSRRCATVASWREAARSSIDRQRSKMRRGARMLGSHVAPMPSTESRSVRPAAGWLRTPLRWLFAAVRLLCGALLVAWASLALYFSNLPWAWARVVLALAFFAFAVWALWLTRARRARWAFAALFLAVVGWFASISPSHDGEWRAEVAVMPRAIIDGDRVRLIDVRHFDYRSRDDFTVRYEDREVSLSHLTAVDFFVSYWMPAPSGTRS